MDVDRILGKAQEEAKRKNFDYSIRLYQEILSIKPDLVEARRGLRQAALKKHSKKYPSRISAVLKGFGPLMSIRMQRASKRHQSLLISCEKYLAHDPKNLKVLNTLGEAALEAKLLDTAIVVFEGITEIHPDNADGFKRLGDLYHKKGRIDEALEAYEKALKARPKDAEIEKARKNLAAEGAIRSTGIDRAGSARDLARDQDELDRIEASKRLIKTPKQLDEAIAAEEAKLKDDPENIRSIQTLAELYHQKGDVDEAIEVLEEALEVNPQAEELRTRIGDWKLRRSRDRVEALRKECNQAALEPANEQDIALRIEEHGRRVKAHPTELKHHYELGSALLDSDRLDDAIAEFQQTIRDPKHRLDSLLKLGDCFFRKKMYDLAAKQLREALEAGTVSGAQSLSIYYTLGNVHEADGDHAAALEAFQRVYEKDIQYKDVANKIEALKSSS